MVPASAAGPALLGRPAGDLLLRVCGTHHDGRVVRLQSAKCTVGSGDRCTLRLRAPGIDPVHCLILRGNDRTVIRRWSPNTRLNGRAFSDASLVPGDRLSIGSLEFEVITPAQAEHTEPALLSSTPNESHTTLTNRIAELERENRDLTYNLEHHRQEWHTQRQQWEEERRAADGAMANRWRQLEVVEAELEARRQQADESTGTASETQTAELDELRRQIAQERERWQHDRQAAEAELAARSKRLEEETTHLTARQREFEELQAKLARQSAEVEELQRQLAAEREAWQETRDEAKQRLAARSEDLDQRSAELDRRQEQLEEEFSELAEQQAELESQAAARTEHDDRDAADVGHDRNEDKSQKRGEGSDLLARLRELQAYRPEDDERAQDAVEEVTAEDEAAEEAAERLAEEVAAAESRQEIDEVPASVERRRQPRQAQEDASEQENHEESIEDYMARLIHRMRGGSDDKAPTKQETAAKKAAAQKAAKQVREKVAPEPVAEPPQKLAASEYIPRSSAPEQSSSLSAMRELANMSARTAIGKHHKSRSSREASQMVIMAGMSASLGLVLVFLCAGNLTLMLGAALGLGFSGYCAWQAVVHTRESRKEHDMNTAYEHIEYESPHHKLWVKMLPTLERWQQKLESKFASLRKKK